MANEIVEKNLALKKLMLSLADKRAWEYNAGLIEQSLAELEKGKLAGRDEVIVVGHGTSFATALCASSWLSHISRISSKAMTGYEFRQYMD